MKVRVEGTECDYPSLTKPHLVVASDEMDGLTVNLPPPAEISPADTDTITIENYIPPPEDFQNPKANVDTTIINSPTEDSTETTDSSETDSDLCCLTLLKKRKDPPYQKSKQPELPVAVVQQPNLSQVPSPTCVEARRERIHRYRVQHYIKTHGGFELSLEPNPPSGSSSISKEQAGPSPSDALPQLETSNLTKSWQQAPCSCMQPMLTLQREQSPLHIPRGPSMRPSEPNNAQLTPVHRKYITSDPFHETYFAKAIRNLRADTLLYVELTNYPIYSSATLTYSTVIYICNKYDGYQSLFVAPYQQNTLYAEYATVQCARAAVAGLNGFRVSEEGHVFRVKLVPLPYNAQRVTLAVHL